MAPNNVGSLVTVAALATSLLLGACGDGGPQQIEFVEFGQPQDDTERTSLVAVLADPSRFNGQRIRVQGVLHIEFEANQLCLDRASVESFVPTNCLRLGLGQQLVARERELAQWNGRYATLVGTVRPTTTHDHFSGRIDDVVHLMVMTSRRRL
ncbi:MAG TPA: hypothetical protein VF179_13245 [Thermoanaerobaculia bacterium]|nr:hypothetical protein [Thermoanaerobaculia bacterium]